MQYGLFLYLCVSENLIILKYKFFWESSDWNVVVIVVVQSLSHVWLFVTPWTAARQASLSLTISLSLLKLISIESVMPSNHLVICRPLLLLPSIFPSIRVISNESALRMRWPKYRNFSFSISPEYSGLISFRMDRFDLLAVQGTLKSLFQHHSSKASILWHSYWNGHSSTPFISWLYKITENSLNWQRSVCLWVYMFSWEASVWLSSFPKS